MSYLTLKDKTIAQSGEKFSVTYNNECFRPNYSLTLRYVHQMALLY